MLGGICTGEIKIGDSYDEWLAALEDTGPGCPGRRAPPKPAGVAGNLPADVVITTGRHRRAPAPTTSARRRRTGRTAADRRHRHAAGPPRRAGGTAGRPLHHRPARQSAGGHDGSVHHRRDRCWRRWGTGPLPPVAQVPCGSTIEPDPGRTRLMPFRLLYGMASPAQHTGPGMMRGLAAADGVLVVPAARRPAGGAGPRLRAAVGPAHPGARRHRGAGQDRRRSAPPGNRPAPAAPWTGAPCLTDGRRRPGARARVPGTGRAWLPLASPAGDCDDRSTCC